MPVTDMSTYTEIKAALMAGRQAFNQGELFGSNPFDRANDAASANMWETGWLRAESAKLREDIRVRRERLRHAITRRRS